MIGLLILLLLFALLALSLPIYPFSRAWGYVPASVSFALLLAWVFVLYFGWVVIWWPWSSPGVAY